MVQMHKILIGVVLMALIVAGFMQFYSAGVDTYNTVDYNQSKVSRFSEKLDEIKTISTDIKNETETIDSASGITDILGGLFSQAYRAAKLIKASTDTFGAISQDAMDGLPINSDYANLLTVGAGLLVIIILFVAILLHVLTKSDRT